MRCFANRSGLSSSSSSSSCFFLVVAIGLFAQSGVVASRPVVAVVVAVAVTNCGGSCSTVAAFGHRPPLRKQRRQQQWRRRQHLLPNLIPRRHATTPPALFVVRGGNALRRPPLPPPMVGAAAAAALGWTLLLLGPPISAPAIAAATATATVQVVQGETSSSPATSTVTATTEPQQLSWNFGSSNNHHNHNNNVVTLSPVTRVGETLRLAHPKLLGSGAGGAVFATTPVEAQPPRRLDGSGGGRNFAPPSAPAAPASAYAASSSSHRVALKVSWRGSAAEVAHECDMLQRLQEKLHHRHHHHHTDGRGSDDAHSSSSRGSSRSSLEVCLAMAPYPLDAARTMIALQPVFGDDGPDDDGHQFVAAVADLADAPRRAAAIADIVRTMLQLLSVGIVTVDVQPLIAAATGHVLFVDFTEAVDVTVRASSSSSRSETRTDNRKDDNNARNFIDLDAAAVAVVNDFVAEMMALLPLDAVSTATASSVLVQQLEDYPLPSPYMYRLLLEQNFDPTALSALQQQLAAVSRGQ